MVPLLTLGVWASGTSTFDVLLLAGFGILGYGTGAKGHLALGIGHR